MMALPAALIPILLSLAADTVDVGPANVAPSEDPYAGNICVECHRKEGGRLAEIVDVEWARSVHYDNNVGCEQCHGGEAALLREDFATDEEFKAASHATFFPEFLFLRNRAEVGVHATHQEEAYFACRECHSWTTEKGLGSPHGGGETLTCIFKRYAGASMTRERGITYICAPCHPESTEKHLGSPHGSRGAPSCLFCHGEGGHAMERASTDIIDPRPREELGRCSLCHTTSNMMSVRHIRETMEESAERIQQITEQYEDLQRSRYRNLALGEMYAHVDDIWLSLRQVQHGCNVREVIERAKSIENISKRIAYDHELVTALHAARQAQTKIALGVAGLLFVLVGLLSVYKRSFGARVEPWILQNPIRSSLTPPCNHDCPAGNNVQGFIAALAERDRNRALRILLETTPFPGVCGRVCPAPCMDICNRGLYDESINIRELERYAADHGQCEDCIKPWRGEQIAIVGSGPAGLSAAFHLTRLGYPITMFESEEELGGVLRTGIPTYRLPREVLDREIDRVVKQGVSVRTGETITREGLLQLSREYSVVLVATGLQILQTLELGDPTGDFVRQGLGLLNDARKGRADLAGKKVIVIGGGDVAVDVARTALRLSGRAVRLYCVEARDEMPAHAEEVEEALAEGVEINPGWGPAGVLTAGERPTGIKFKRCLSVFDETGRFSPTYDDTQTVMVDSDVIYLALVRSADTAILSGRSSLAEGRLPHEMAGSAVFLCGDFTGTGGIVAAAVGGGRRAAWDIHKTLTGQDLSPPEPAPVATPDHIKMHLFTHGHRRVGNTLPAEVRRVDFAEVRLGLDDSGERRPAIAEAERCFSCGVCNHCDRCVTQCAEGVVMRYGDDYVVDYEYCAGCGICSIECPRGVIHMVDEHPFGAVGKTANPSTGNVT